MWFFSSFCKIITGVFRICKKWQMFQMPFADIFYCAEVFQLNTTKQNGYISISAGVMSCCGNYKRWGKKTHGCHDKFKLGLCGFFCRNSFSQKSTHGSFWTSCMSGVFVHTTFHWYRVFCHGFLCTSEFYDSKVIF